MLRSSAPARPASTPRPAACRRASRSTCSTRCRRRSGSCARASRPTTRTSRRSRASTRRRRPSRASASSAAWCSVSTSRARSCSSATTPSSTRSGRPTTTGSGIPGEDRPGSYPATRFVAWYNGHPDAVDESFDLSAQRAVVIGNGNVAIDVARMLLLDPDELAATDTADHAIGRSPPAQVQEVILLGRRGPEHAAVHQPRAARAGGDDRRRRAGRPGRARGRRGARGSPTKRRNVEILRAYAERAAGQRRAADQAEVPALAGRDPRRRRGRPRDGHPRRPTGSRTAAPSPPARRR